MSSSRLGLIVIKEKEGDTSNRNVSEWLRKNVKEEEHVVTKAEAKLVEEMVKSKAIRLVDELFLECRPQLGHNQKQVVEALAAREIPSVAKPNCNVACSSYFWDVITIYGPNDSSIIKNQNHKK
ncbi:hypothetical protein L6164_025689 [Bauhinia variegata]|uniref:Uncharacterized protein n=1 Tax=Bauhinia variegata TaxID=167791 RepID=A0ACB9M1L2_BAUVA|nr:hypothetical protein L6164_025689 [Bauhinia variegata]